jgi:apolipoprotein N-acyltransferase
VFFGYAWLCFLVWNALTTWWIAYATITGAILVSLLNAAFMATVWWLFHLVKRRFRLLGNLSLVVFWISFEYLHYNWEIQWPWLTLGNGFANQVKLVQWYEYTGVLGGSLWIFILNLLFFRLYRRFIQNERRMLAGESLLISMLLLLPTWISFRTYNRYQEKGKACEIIVLQPNVDPYTEKFDGMSKTAQVNLLLELTDSLLTGTTSYVISPETALPPLWEVPGMNRHPWLFPFYERTLSHPGLKFVLGATTQLRFHEGEKMPSTVRLNSIDSTWYDAYNSALQVDSSGKVQTYHKSILVAGVEKMPFSRYFSFLEKYIIDLGGTTGSLGSQKDPSNFTSERMQVAPVICYESAFGEYLTGYIRKGAGLIFLMTNDGWWKNTPGYRQHLSFARLRAVETRRAIARSANTGISAFINQRGDLTGQTGWWTRTALRGSLHANDSLTFYVRYGDYIGRVSVFMAVMLLLYFLSSSRKDLRIKL